MENKNKPYVIAVRIYESKGVTMADIKTFSYGGLNTESIVWTKPNERERFCYNGYTLFYDERIKNTKPFEEIK